MNKGYLYLRDHCSYKSDIYDVYKMGYTKIILNRAIAYRTCEVEPGSFIMVIEILNKMFEFAGHKVTYEDIKDRQDAWYNDWTITEEQYDKWKQWGTKQIKKKLKYTDVYAERQMSMIGANWGLKFEK